ncbi:GNAT family N-acetyltransferase [Flavobacteriaceae bacterium]|nr:GNAT family N-acetyltransferase [Flavobacteriaceae bacterium]
MKIELITKESELLKKGVDYFWKNWGNESNLNFFKDCIENSFSKNGRIPKFYLMLNNKEIVGCYALLTNDIISRQDLMPWFACLYVEENYRNQGLAEKLLKHSLNESQKFGFDTLYLSTELSNFYEKKGWKYHSKGFGVFGDEMKIYYSQTN